MDGKWLSILEYAAFKKKSISTVRRYIKANRVKYKEDNGKYFIWTKNYNPNITEVEKSQLEIRFENERLKKENRILVEELAELRMLVSIYESEKKIIHSKPILPQLPELPREI